MNSNPSFCIEVLRAAAEDALPAAPLERSYWILPNKFLGGSYPGSPDAETTEARLRIMLGAGIRCFVDLTSPEDRNMYGQWIVPYQNIIEKITGGKFAAAYRRMSILDLNVPSRALMKEILDFVDSTISQNVPVYLHCLGGIGRTGTVVGCWLVRHGIARREAAIDMIQRLRRREPMAYRAAPETAEQRQFILQWQQGE